MTDDWTTSFAALRSDQSTRYFCHIMTFMEDLSNGIQGLPGPTNMNTISTSRLSNNKRYILERRIPVTGPIFALAASSTGMMLAFGGDDSACISIKCLPIVLGEDGIRVFDLKDNYEPVTPCNMPTTLRQISSVCWVTGIDDPWETLCFCTGRGNLVFWRQNTRLVGDVCHLNSFSSC